LIINFFPTDSFSDFATAYPELAVCEETEIPSTNNHLAARPSDPPQDSPAKIKITDLEPTLILPGLYIGAKKDAHNASTLERLGVDAIVNVTRDITNKFPEKITYINIPVDVSSQNYLA
jgi:hypothetical protein